MHHTLFVQRLRVLGSMAFFSLVTAPALALFIAVIGLAFSQSLSGQFLATAHELIDGAPRGAVNATVCVPPTALDGGEVKSLAKTPPLLCQDAVTDERAWRHDTDRAIRQLYLLASLIGLGVWLMLNPIGQIWRDVSWRHSDE